MRKWLAIMFVATLGTALPMSVRGQDIDGFLDPIYGAALSVQDTQTEFGDSNLGDPEFANGSELDAAHARIVDEVGLGQVLYLFFAGNLESNFNKFEIFLDTKPGGQNRLRGDNPDVDFNGLNRMGDDGSANGLTFDPGFAADYWVSLTGGGPNYDLFGNYSELLTNGAGTGYYLGQGDALTDGTLTGGTQNPFDVRITINNFNTLGVTGGPGLGSGAGVDTGVELRIPLAALGDAACDIRVSAFINGGGHDFLSNQVVGPIGGGVNLGEPRAVNFGNVPGNQFFLIDNPFFLPGDGNGDHIVTGADFTIWADGFGLFSGDATLGDGDYNCDGFVTGADFTIWADNFGSMLTPVPEPSSLALAGLGAMAAAAFAARRRG